MDLSGLKWPLIIVIVVGVGWLMTSGGITYMVNNFTKVTPGQDVERDKVDEAGLTRVGGYLLLMWRYQKAADVMQTSIDRYGPSGANYWHNLYRVAKCYDRMGQYQQSYDVLQQLITANASQYDDRVPENDNLSLRASKLKEMYELK
jgi:tetratricopeptide (TPR) repeat protein